MKKVLITILLLLLVFAGCKEKSHVYRFEYTHIPSVIQEKSEQREYLSLHFWDNLPWDDSTVNITENHLRVPYYEYLQIIKDFGVSKAGKLLNDLAKKSSLSTKPISSSLLTLFEESLNDPNSPMRHDALYLNVIEAYIQNLPVFSEDRLRLIEEREMLLKNRIGEISEDFTILYSDGSTSTLHNIKSDYTLILFFEPNCRACKESIIFAEKSKIIKDFQKRFISLAIYTGNNSNYLESAQSLLRNTWKVGSDLNGMITRDKLYDRRASPSVYLLDKEKKVLLKDGDMESAEKFIIENINLLFQ